MVRRVYCRELGRVLEVPDRVGRIASLTPSVTEVLVEMGLKDLIVGVSPWCRLLRYYGYGVPDVPVIGSYDSLNEELIRELRPDVALIAGGYQVRLAGKLSELGVPYYVTMLPRGLEMLELPVEVGYVLGRVDEGLRLSSVMVSELSRALSYVKSSRAEGVKAALFMEIGELVVPGLASHATQVLQVAGLRVTNRFVESSYVWGAEAREIVKELIMLSDVILVQVGSIKPSIRRAVKVLGVGRVSKPIIALPILYLSDYGPSFIRRVPDLAENIVKAVREGVNLELHPPAKPTSV